MINFTLSNGGVLVSNDKLINNELISLSMIKF
nr:MAG TPA: hypothetical protein [Caudoviricetes sp.]